MSRYSADSYIHNPYLYVSSYDICGFFREENESILGTRNAISFSYLVTSFLPKLALWLTHRKLENIFKLSLK